MVTFKDERIATIVFCCKQGATISHFEREKQAQSFSIKRPILPMAANPYSEVHRLSGCNVSLMIQAIPCVSKTALKIYKE